MTTIDTDRPILILDDRSREENLLVSHVLYENREVILVRAIPYHFDRNGLLKTDDDEAKHMLIERSSGQVRCADYDAWIAENPDETRLPVPVKGDPLAEE